MQDLTVLTDLVVLVKMPTVRMVAGSYSGITTWGGGGFCKAQVIYVCVIAFQVV